MAEAILGEIADVKAALENNGALSFIHNGTRTRSEWRGLVDALSIQVPEQFQVEFVDAMPGGFDTWWDSWGIQDAFVESARWRTTGAFSQRTLDLFNCLDSERERISLLIELSASISQPWNAELIHRNLSRRKMVDRDAFWSVQINKATNSESHPVHRLIDWCLNSQKGTSQETHWLCALTLTWCFSSSSRPIRDLATKALTGVLLKQPDIFSRLADAFQEVDDGYILERIYAAGYGACCIDPSRNRTVEYAKKTAINVFGQGVPFLNLLLRDYARGIVELANHIGTAQKDVLVGRCRPPYASTLPVFRLTDSDLTKLTDKAGDKSIWHSCDQFGDFGRYEIDPNVGKFVAVKLARPAPYTSQERFERFKKEVVRDDSDRASSMERLQNIIFGGTRIIFRLHGQTKPRTPTKAAIRKREYEVRAAEREFIGLLSPGERKRYHAEAKPWLKRVNNQKTKQPRQIDLAGARRWVAKRAYHFGWNKTLFQHDSGARFEYQTDRAHIERIGKKYQWLALSELLCRLSDNYWIGGTHGDRTREYDNPTDIGFSRDIDPTVLPTQVTSSEDLQIRDLRIDGPLIRLSQTAEDELTKWPFAIDLAGNFEQLVCRVDRNSEQWIVLYDSNSAIDRYNPRIGSHGLRQQEFRRVFNVVINRVNMSRFTEYLKTTRKIDVMRWDPPELTDGPYLREAAWRSTWPQTQWCSDGWCGTEGVPIAFPLSKYVWESPLDASLPQGASAFIPSPWLLAELKLSLDPSDIAICRNDSGGVRFIASKRGADGSWALINKALFWNWLGRHGLECVWLLVAERSVWPGGENDNAAWRRTEGVCWTENGKLAMTSWNEDRVNRGNG